MIDVDDFEYKAPSVFWRTGYNYDREAESLATGLACEGEGLTQQSFADECDINTIVRRFGISGQLPTNVRMPTYGDFDGVSDYHSAMNAIALAGESFDTMPAEVRARFHNDPGEFVDFCSNADNRDEAIKLGLVLPQAAALAADAPAVGETPAAPASSAPGA